MLLTRRLLLSVPLLASTASAPAADMAEPRQVVVISFDGAQHVAQWKRSRALAERTGARFTYFLSCVYLLSPEHRALYQGPAHRPGRSNVGFGGSTEEVAERLGEIWAARQEGHEIASHGCGHFDGKDWSVADWTTEFAAFTRIVRDAYAINGIEGEPEGWRALVEDDIRGFRAPYLSTSEALFQALGEAGMDYDASGVSKGPATAPMQDGLRRFALPMVPEGPAARPVIAMDYNLFARHSNAEETEDRDGRFAERAYKAFKAAFDEQHDGRRIPLQIGYHFTLMNGGAYWRALERFAEEVCVMPDVDCISYEDLNRRLGEGADG
ncbi:polysaccharide deacetylase [Aquibium microcysteis]|uniref:polysaccharide deacetylase n=1 Tax=Aquibium microcysteis TaxID=675281 RepID=UPI00165D0486|nr:polysaccharide deacetylase [Aquibium microcysteis]